MKLVGVDVGSTTVKAVVVDDGGVMWRDYQRHNTRQAEKLLELLERMEAEAGLVPGRDRVRSPARGRASWARSWGASWSRRSSRSPPASSASIPTCASCPRSAART